MIAFRLSVMMFIQFFVWGAWYVTAYLFLGKIGFGGTEIGWTYSVGPIAGMISPFVVGMVADRFFSTERVLAVMHLSAGVFMFVAINLMQAESPSPFWINLFFFAHMLCYFPTLALTNSLALNNMTNAEKQFPLIRVFGTIGWIVAGIFISLQEWDAAIQMFYVAAGAAIVMGLYSLTLPHTPPPSAGKKATAREILGLDALVLFKNRSFLMFMVSSFLVCIPLAFYFQMAGKFVEHSGQANVALKMTFGQMSEILFMLVMPLFFARLGVKWMLFVGMLAWVARYSLFALGADEGVAWMILLGIILHGICYDFSFVTGQIYTDKVAPSAIRAQAQGMLVLFTLGLGMFIGAQLAGQVEEKFTPSNSADLTKQADDIMNKMNTLQIGLDEIHGVKDQPRYMRWWRAVFPMKLDDADEEKARDLTAKLEQLRTERSVFLLQSVHWKNVWIYPAAGAAVIMVLFVLFFKDDTQQSPVSQSDAARAAAAEEQP